MGTENGKGRGKPRFDSWVKAQKHRGELGKMMRKASKRARKKSNDRPSDFGDSEEAMSATLTGFRGGRWILKKEDLLAIEGRTTVEVPPSIVPPVGTLTVSPFLISFWGRQVPLLRPAAGHFYTCPADLEEGKQGMLRLMQQGFDVLLARGAAAPGREGNHCRCHERRSLQSLQLQGQRRPCKQLRRASGGETV